MRGDGKEGKGRTGARTQVSARSSPLTQSCWKVAWAATVEADARARMAVFIVGSSRDSGGSMVRRRGSLRLAVGWTLSGLVALLYLAPGLPPGRRACFPRVQASTWVSRPRQDVPCLPGATYRMVPSLLITTLRRPRIGKCSAHHEPSHTLFIPRIPPSTGLPHYPKASQESC